MISKLRIPFLSQSSPHPRPQEIWIELGPIPQPAFRRLLVFAGAREVEYSFVRFSDGIGALQLAKMVFANCMKHPEYFIFRCFVMQMTPKTKH